MTRGSAPSRRRATFRLLGCQLVFAVLMLLSLAALQPLLAQSADAASPDSNNFSQYVVDHQDDLAPFFSKNAGDFFRLAVPALLGMAGWVILITMLVGWGLDVLMSRGYAFFYAPAFADWKRAMIYATGSLFLSFIYTGMMGLTIVLLIGFAQAAVIIPLALILLLLVAIAAQIVWILYLYHTDFGVTILFYVALVVVHAIAGSLIVQPIISSRASLEMTNYVDNVITPRLQVEAKAERQELNSVTSDRDSAQARVAESQGEITQAETEQAQLTQEIEDKKNSDLYTLAQIIKARARGELESARDELAAFPVKFPSSPLNAQARSQLAAVNAQITAEQAQRKQQEADATRAFATARADLLAKAAKSQATLSEMRQALLGKSRSQVSDLLGPPTDTGSDQWFYRQQMIVNPLTSEHTGLTVYFSQGLVQSVDYNRSY